MADRIASSCQPIQASARRAWRLGAFVTLAAIAVPARGDVTPVEILALGQQVERLGSLSSFGDTLCLAADGRVAAGVSGVDGEHALACGDATGFSAIVREGDPSPRGGTFADFTDCALPGDGGVYFAAMRRAGLDGALIEDVYRATPHGIEWIVGAGAVATDGTRLLALAALNGSNVRGWPVFEANDRGTVLVRARASNATVLVRVRMLGAPEALRASRGTGRPWIYGNRDDAGLAGDDTVLALAILPSDEPGIVALDGEQVRVLFTLADILADIPVVDGALNFSLYSIETRGEVFSFAIEYFTVHDGRSQSYWQNVLHTPMRGFAPFVDPALYDAIWVVDFTPTGRALIVGLIDRPYPNYTDNVVIDDSGLTLISHDLGRHWAHPDALALNDRGNVLLQTRTTFDSDVRRSLALTGPAPDPETRCFIPPTALEPTGTATETPSPTPSATPSVTPTAGTDCAAQPEACAHLRVHSLRGVPGERVTLAVSLDSGPWALAGVKGDLRVPQSAPLATGASGEPACRINPAIDKSDSRFAFRPAACTENCTQVRAVALAFDNIDPIANNATVFECDLVIRADAQPGDYPLTLERVEAANTDGHATPIDGIGNTLEVQAVSNQAATGNAVDAAAGSDSGCHVGPARQHGMWPVALLAVMAIAARRLRAIRHGHRRRMMATVRGTLHLVASLAILEPVGDAVNARRAAGIDQPFACAGDCNDDRRVMIGELVGCARASLESIDAPPSCCDADSDRILSVADLVTAVRGALDGCGAPCFFGSLSGSCADGEQCDVWDSQCAGWTDRWATSVCVPVATDCPPDDEPVCGCNGVTYANDCERRGAGVTRQASGRCEKFLCCPAGAFATGSILVEFKPGTTPQQAAEIAAGLGASVLQHFVNIDVYHIGVPSGRERELVAAFQQRPEVESASTNGISCFPESPRCACCPPSDRIQCPHLPPCLPP